MGPTLNIPAVPFLVLLVCTFACGAMLWPLIAAVLFDATDAARSLLDSILKAAGAIAIAAAAIAIAWKYGS